MQKNIYQRNLLIPFVKILIDCGALEGAFIFSFYARFHSPLQHIFPVTKGYPPFYNYFIASLFLTGVYLIIFSSLHSYRSRYFSTFTQDIPVILKTCFWGILFAMSLAFLYRGFSYSRLAFLLMFINTNIFVLLGRFIFHRLRKILVSRGYSIQKLILVGYPEIIPRMIQQIEKEQKQSFDVMGYCSDSEVREVKPPYLGTLQDMEKVLIEFAPDGLLLVLKSKDHDQILRIMEYSEGKNIELFFVPDLIDLVTSRTTTVEISGLPVFRLKAVAFSGWQGLLKRTFDLVVSVIALILLSPLFLVIALLIRAGSAGSIFYTQKRVGLDGKEFTMLKFRSMIIDAEKKTGPVWAQENDPRVTTVGRMLRRTSLDELPQLINVVRGEMSLIGPRPERGVFVEEFKQVIPKYAERHRVRSGVTGWAQVNGLRGQSPIEERTRYDVYYIENWSLWFDIKILLMTIITILKGENAY